LEPESGGGVHIFALCSLIGLLDSAPLSNDDLVFGSGTAILEGGICGRYARKSAQALLDEWFDLDLSIVPWFSQERAKAREAQKRVTDWFVSTPVIAASIIAAARLAREQDISRPSPRLTSVVTDSIAPARMILEKIAR